MVNLHNSILWISLVALIFISGFFSAAETGMMALNRYRLRHLVRKGNRTAKRVSNLLRRPDRLLGVVLLGNTFANILASAVATILAARYFGDFGVLVATIALTIVVLIFAETMPKTFAALHPQSVSFGVSWLLQLILRLLYPLVWLINGISNTLLLLFRVKVKGNKAEQLSLEELRSVVLEASGKISVAHHRMLLRILELEQATIDEVMVPRKEIQGIDVTAPWEQNLQQLIESSHQYLPVYREDIDQAIGMLNLRTIIPLLRKGDITIENLLSAAEEIYYISELTLINHQLLNFQQENRSIGLVVDEYGDIQGLVTLQDILEEIVGQFAVDAADTERLVRKQKDGSFLVDGSINIRDLNRIAEWNLPTDGPRTLSGLIIEELGVIPDSNLCLKLAGHPIEILKVSGNKIRLVQFWAKQLRNE